jgi:hypothetical protein
MINKTTEPAFFTADSFQKNEPSLFSAKAVVFSQKLQDAPQQ